MVIFNEGYYQAMDRNYYGPAGASHDIGDVGGPINLDAPKPVYEIKPTESKLGPQEIGTTTHPMQNTLQSLTAKIRSGAGKIEFSFIGQGKTSSQQPGPETFGSKERRDMKELVEFNKIRTSTHASVHTESLGGLTGGEGGGGSGFRRQAQQKILKEIEKAIHFAGEATRGGAVVFHTSEFPRQMVDIKEGSHEAKFKAYEGEEKEGVVYFVDERTGDLVQSVRKDQKYYEPVFETVEKDGQTFYKDLSGNLIPEDAPPDILFDRIPKWNKDKTNFEVKERDWKYFEKKAEQRNDLKRKKLGRELNKDETITPGQMALMTQLENQILELKGSSLYHAQRYNEYLFQKKKIEEALDFYNKLEKTMPEKEKWKIMIDRLPNLHSRQFTLSDKESPSDLLKRELDEVNNSMRHTHESSASADARAEEQQKRLDHIKPIERFAPHRTHDTLARAGMTAFEYTKKNQDRLSEPIFIAPENFMPNQYGSHPDEIREVVLGGRAEMAKKLVRNGYSKKEAADLAKKHIQATLDIGHMNLWRQHFERKEGESIEEKDARFNKWIIEETEKLAKEGIVGHVHLTDNFGYDDEHITPGEGNVPMKEFIDKMQKAGMDDFIAEAGSFNGETVMHDTWALVNGPVYSFARGPGFKQFHEAHFGYAGPPNYIVGAYSPSNEWKLWSEVPLE